MFPLLPSDGAQEETVKGCPAFAVVEWVQVPLYAPIQSDLRDFGSEEWYFDIKGGVSMVVHRLAVALETGVRFAALPCTEYNSS